MRLRDIFAFHTAHIALALALALGIGIGGVESHLTSVDASTALRSPHVAGAVNDVCWSECIASYYDNYAGDSRYVSVKADVFAKMTTQLTGGILANSSAGSNGSSCGIFGCTRDYVGWGCVAGSPPCWDAWFGANWHICGEATCSRSFGFEVYPRLHFHWGGGDFLQYYSFNG